jgi:hypothetical protein
MIKYHDNGPCFASPSRFESGLCYEECWLMVENLA